MHIDRLIPQWDSTGFTAGRMKADKARANRAPMTNRTVFLVRRIVCVITTQHAFKHHQMAAITRLTFTVITLEPFSQITTGGQSHIGSGLHLQGQNLNSQKCEKFIIPSAPGIYGIILDNDYFSGMIKTSSPDVISVLLSC